MDKHTYCVIMAGGIGSRFWPKSRQSKPKQFLDILGTGKSFIRMTYERFEKLAPAENFLVVTNARYKDLVLEQIPELGPEQVLCEPVGRNTAPCICYAAYGLQKRDPGAKMIVTPADHLILNEEDFRAIIGECLDFIDDRAALMTVGIKPTRPETGYGYIQVSDDRTISKVKCFTENPTWSWRRRSCNAANFSGTPASSSGKSATSSKRCAPTCPSTTPSSRTSSRYWALQKKRKPSPGYSPNAAPSRSTTA